MVSRRDFLGLFASGVASFGAMPAFALGEDSRTHVGVLRVGPNWNDRPNALRRLLWETGKRTSIEVAAQGTPTDIGQAMFQTPLVVWRGEGAFDALSEKERALLSRFVRFGGLLWIDAPTQDAPFLESVTRELDAILPKVKAQNAGKEHVIFKSFFLLDHAYGQNDDAVNVEILNVNDRAAVVITRCDVLGAYERDRIGTWRFECTPGGERQRERAFRFGVNMLMYATCLDYKADQVHIKFIMKKKRR